MDREFFDRSVVLARGGYRSTAERAVAAKRERRDVPNIERDLGFWDGYHQALMDMGEHEGIAVEPLSEPPPRRLSIRG